MGKTINLVRGSTNTFDIALRDEKGAFYALGSDEILRFGVKKTTAASAYKLVKELTAADLSSTGDAYVLILHPEDTENLESGDYVYDIGMQSGADYYNVVPCSDFILHPNITGREVLT